MAKTYKCYYGSDVDFEFVVTYCGNRNMLTAEDLEMIDHVHTEVCNRPSATMGYACTEWKYYNRLKEFCLMASEYRAASAKEWDVEYVN